ncbi:MAG: DUF1573 domain-containing protein [Cyclobacteriaceae bacterium]|nr:DUF1573 domain-containing protein [Cyclobacteriaceae bacterium]
MKRFLITLLFISSVSWAQTENNVPGPAITFEESSFDFGDIYQGDKVEHIFAFENTGDAPLIITNVQVTCGCTATEWKREPILPGEKSSIRVNFDSAHKVGRQNKVITIVSNSVAPLNQVKIVTNVLPPKKDSDSQ